MLIYAGKLFLTVKFSLKNYKQILKRKYILKACSQLKKYQKWLKFDLFWDANMLKSNVKI